MHNSTAAGGVAGPTGVQCGMDHPHTRGGGSRILFHPIPCLEERGPNRRPAMHAQLEQNLLGMAAGRVLGNTKRECDLTIGVPVREQERDAGLGVGEAIVLRALRLPRRRWTAGLS